MGTTLTQTLLKSSGDEKSSTLTSQLYHLDQAGKMDSTNVNTGGTKACSPAGNTSLTVSLFFRRTAIPPLFQQRRYILNQTDIHVKLFRQRPSFCLMAPDGEYDIVLEDVVLKVAKVRLNPAVILAHGKLQSSNAKYPLVRSEIKMFSYPPAKSAVISTICFKTIVLAKLSLDLYHRRLLRRHNEKSV